MMGPPVDVGSTGPTQLSTAGVGELAIPDRSFLRRPSQVVSMGDVGVGFRLKVEQVRTPGGKNNGLLEKINERNSTAALMLGMKLTPVQLESSTTRDILHLKHADEVMALAFSPDGTRLVSGGEDALVVIWDMVAGGTRLAEIKVESQITAVAYSPNARYFAASTA